MSLSHKPRDFFSTKTNCLNPWWSSNHFSGCAGADEVWGSWAAGKTNRRWKWGQNDTKTTPKRCQHDPWVTPKWPGSTQKWYEITRKPSGPGRPKSRPAQLWVTQNGAIFVPKNGPIWPQIGSKMAQKRSKKSSWIISVSQRTEKTFMETNSSGPQSLCQDTRVLLGEKTSPANNAQKDIYQSKSWGHCFFLHIGFLLARFARFFFCVE